jgi:hypothetical protein
MIPQIKEINFPEYATLSTATASLVDMGEKSITTQVKIDGSITPDFSYDWAIEFQGETYIQPLREPQASKGNESISSLIDLTFYHKGIYDLKRYFFVSVVELNAGTLMADNYIVPLRLNIAEFVDYLNNVLSYYYGSTYKVFLNPDYEYEETDRKDIDINYTKIWDVLTKTYEWFGVRWTWETQQDDVEYYFIKIGYPSIEVSHTFEYGFEGGLLKFERQVQDPEIANMVFGRGSSENIPFRYFKNKSEDNPTFPADPDWIPELENIYFANLRGKTFRDYVKGWKSNPNRDTLNGTLKIEPIDPNLFLTSFAYNRGLEDTKFAPIEYVKNDISIQEYGEIQKGLEHNEEIKPTIQGVTIDGIGRVDEIVDVEPILVDESTEDTEIEGKVIDIEYDERVDVRSQSSSYVITTTTKRYVVPNGYVGAFLKDASITATEFVNGTFKSMFGEQVLSEKRESYTNPLRVEVLFIRVINDNTKEEITNLVNIQGGTNIRVEYSIRVTEFLKNYREGMNVDGVGWVGNILTLDDSGYIVASFSWQLDYTPVHGQILGNYESGTIRKSQSKTISANGTSQVVFTTEQFTIAEKDAPATSVEMPYRITSSLKGGAYDARPNVVAINVETGETITSLNLPAGTYYLQNSIQIANLADQQQTFKVELLPTYIYYSYDSASWKPTFDICVKNIWQTTPNKLEEDYAYEHRVWDAILGNHLGDDAKVVFSSGRLSGHSDWEFLIADTPKRDTSKTINGVPSEWRITLYKSDAEMEATDKWLPSIMTQANAGDHFYFVGIEMPHQYVLWAEEKLDKYKIAELSKVLDVTSTIVVQLDKVRLNQLRENNAQPLLNSLRVGNYIKVADSRFIKSPYRMLHLQSITYTWELTTIMLPNIEVVLSNEIATHPNPFEDIKRKIDNTEDRIKDVRKTSLAQINKAKKSIQSANTNIKTLSTGSTDVYNQVNVLIGDDKWMSVREIASSVLGDADIDDIETKLNTLIGNDKRKSVRDIIADNVVALEDADTDQDTDGLTKAKDAITFFGGMVSNAIDKEIQRANKAYATIATVTEQGGRITTVTNVANQAKQDAILALQKLATLQGDGEGSISRQITEEVASIIASAPEDLEILQEIANFLEADPTRAGEIVAKLDDHEQRLNELGKEKIEVLSQSEYDSIGQKSEDTLYFIYEE